GGDGRAGLGTCTTNPETVSTTSRSNTSIAWFSIDGIGSGRRHCVVPSGSSPALSAVLSQWGYRVADTPPLPELDPLFLRCLKEAAANPEFVAEFDRLTSSNLSMRGSPLELAIDREAG